MERTALIERDSIDLVMIVKAGTKRATIGLVLAEMATIELDLTGMAFTEMAQSLMMKALILKGEIMKDTIEQGSTEQGLTDKVPI